MGWNVIDAEDNIGSFMINVLGYAVFGDEDGILTVRVRKIPGFTAEEAEASALEELGLTARHEVYETLSAFLGFRFVGPSGRRFRGFLGDFEADYSLE